MSVSDGQPADDNIFNAAFASKTTDNTLSGVQALESATSGGNIADAQQKINDNTSSATTNASDISTNTTNIATNTAKVTNANHTGDVTGDTALTLESVAITGQASATVASGDTLIISDLDDSGNLKEVTAQSIADLGGGGGGATTELDNLGTVSFNADIIPAGIGVRSIGSSTNYLFRVWTNDIIFKDSVNLGIINSNVSGAALPSGNSAKFTIANATPTISSNVALYTDSNTSTTVDTSDVFVETGNNSGSSGTIDTGDISIKSGNLTNAGNGGDSGAINAETGSVAGAGVRGAINLKSDVIKIFDDQLAFFSNEEFTNFFGGDVEGLFFDSVAIQNSPIGNDAVFIMTTDTIATSGTEPEMYVQTGSVNNTGSTRTGSFFSGSGSNVNGSATGNTGEAAFSSGGNSGSGTSGPVQVRSGSTSGGTSGTATLKSGPSSAGNSGDAVVESGSASGTRGDIKLNGNRIDASLSVGPFRAPNLAADPASPLDGDFWYNTTSDTYKGRENGVTVTFTTT